MRARAQTGLGWGHAGPTGQYIHRMQHAIDIVCIGGMYLNVGALMCD